MMPSCPWRAAFAGVAAGLLAAAAGAQQAARPVVHASPVTLAPAPAASAASAPAKLSPHALAALRRAQEGENAPVQGSFALMGHGRPHRPQMIPRVP